MNIIIQVTEKEEREIWQGLLIALSLFVSFFFVLALWYGWDELRYGAQDWTDTGVGCVDDCLSPPDKSKWIQDEADVELNLEA